MELTFKMNKKRYGNGKQALLDYGKFKLSVVDDGYGGSSGKYEIATMDPDGDFVHLPGITQEDGVQGWMSKEDVQGAMLKLYTITGTVPVQEN